MLTNKDQKLTIFEGRHSGKEFGKALQLCVALSQQILLLLDTVT